MLIRVLDAVEKILKKETIEVRQDLQDIEKLENWLNFRKSPCKAPY